MSVIGNVITVDEAVQRLRDGQVVAIPTETVYGLAARIDRDAAIERIFELKGRPQDNPLIVHVATIEQVEEIAEVSELDRVLMEAFWPGPLTLVLRSRINVGLRVGLRVGLQVGLRVGSRVSAGLDTVAVRMPAAPIAREILQAVGVPLAAPSANRSGRPSATTAQHVLDDHRDAVPVVDGGPCTHGLESTVIRTTDDAILLLRPGMVTRAELEAAAHLPVRDPADADLRRSPGTRHRHYAPNVPVILCETVDQLRQEAAMGRPLILSTQDLQVGGEWHRLDARTVFSEFREAERSGVEKILVHLDESVRADEALMNRLRRAAEL